MHWTEKKSVYFVEGAVPGMFVEGRYAAVPGDGFKPSVQIDTGLNDVFSQNHLKNLGDLKERMAEMAKQHDCNCICNFSYGWRSTFWESMLGMDNVFWFGSGVAGRVTEDMLRRIK